MTVDADDGTHEVNDVIWRESLVLVRLPDVFVEGREEEIENILPLRCLVVDVRKNAVCYEI